MTTDPSFKAPWSKALTFATLSVTVLVLACAAGLIVAIGDPIALSSAATLLAIWVGAALFAVRGYVLSPSALVVQRLLWRTEVSLDGLIRAVAEPRAMSGSYRLAGNGGLFSFSGQFTNRQLGRYRAFATAPRLAVVLELPKQKIVVTPDQPERFLSTLHALYPTANVVRNDA